MIRRFLQNPAVQNFGKQVIRDVASSAAEDVVSNTTGVQPGRSGAVTPGEVLYNAGKGALTLHSHIEAARQQREAQQEAAKDLQRKQLIAQVLANAQRRCR